MAGYSGTPLARKLGIVAGTRVALIGGPDDFLGALAPIPPGVEFLEAAEGRAGVVILFAASRAVLDGELPDAVGRMDVDGGLWVAWPKKASGVATDLTETPVRAAGLAAGLVDNKVCAVDATWSGLRFVVPLRHRGTWRGKALGARPSG